MQAEQEGQGDDSDDDAQEHLEHRRTQCYEEECAHGSEGHARDDHLPDAAEADIPPGVCDEQEVLRDADGNEYGDGHLRIEVDGDEGGPRR